MNNKISINNISVKAFKNSNFFILLFITGQNRRQNRVYLFFLLQVKCN